MKAKGLPVVQAALFCVLLPGGVSAEVPSKPPHPCLENVADAVVEVVPGAGRGLFRDEEGRDFRLADVNLSTEGERKLRSGDRGRTHFAYPAGPPDRWGMIPAWIVSGKADGLTLLQETALENGDAIVTPDLGGLSCTLRLKRAESHARRQERNLWRTLTVHDSRDPDGLLERTGHYVLVEGRVVSLGKTTRTRYLNFGYRWKRDFTATIGTSEETGFEELLARSGSSLDELDGAVVRVRGYLQEWDGPHIRLEHAGQLDVIDWKRTGRDEQPRIQ